MNGTSSESSSQRHDLGLHSFMTAISIAGNGISSSISNLWERCILSPHDLVQSCSRTPAGVPGLAIVAKAALGQLSAAHGLHVEERPHTGQRLAGRPIGASADVGQAPVRVLLSFGIFEAIKAGFVLIADDRQFTCKMTLEQRVLTP